MAQCISTDICLLLSIHRFEETHVGSPGPGGSLGFHGKDCHHLYLLQPLCCLPPSLPLPQNVSSCPNLTQNSGWHSFIARSQHQGVTAVSYSINATLYIGKVPVQASLNWAMTSTEVAVPKNYPTVKTTQRTLFKVKEHLFLSHRSVSTSSVGLNASYLFCCHNSKDSKGKGERSGGNNLA